MPTGDDQDDMPTGPAALAAAKVARLPPPIAAPWGGGIHTGKLARDAAVEHEELVQMLVSVHRTCADPLDWSLVAALAPPLPPRHPNKNEKLAQQAYDSYRPSLPARLFGRVRHERRALKNRIAEGWVLDDKLATERNARHEAELALHAETTGLALRVLAREPAAYAQALEQYQPLAATGVFGQRAVMTAMTTRSHAVRLLVKPFDVLPRDRVRQLASGRIAVEPYPQPDHVRLLREHVCSAGLRVAREMFALLPLEEVIVTVVDDTPDAASGEARRRTMLRFGASRADIDAFDFYEVDSVEAMMRLWHRADFEGSGRLAALQPEFAETD